MGTVTEKVPEPGIFHISGGIGTGIENIWYRIKVWVSVSFNILGTVTHWKTNFSPVFFADRVSYSSASLFDSLTYRTFLLLDILWKLCGFNLKLLRSLFVFCVLSVTLCLLSPTFSENSKNQKAKFSHQVDLQLAPHLFWDHIFVSSETSYLERECIIIQRVVSDLSSI